MFLTANIGTRSACPAVTGTGHASGSPIPPRLAWLNAQVNDLRYRVRLPKAISLARRNAPPDTEGIETAG